MPDYNETDKISKQEERFNRDIAWLLDEFEDDQWYVEHCDYGPQLPELPEVTPRNPLWPARYWSNKYGCWTDGFPADLSVEQDRKLEKIRKEEESLNA